jgi:DNA-binding winged helix-turn-helix (wHTH) protein/TolB-like protein
MRDRPFRIMLAPQRSDGLPGPIVFGPFRVDPDRAALWRGGRQVAVGQRSLALLAALVREAGRPVTKAALMEAAWPGLAVEEANLSVQIAALRRALGVRPDGKDWIVTLPRIGYRIALEPAPAAPGSPADVIRLVVQPFEAAEADYFARGVVADMIAALVRFRSFAVIAASPAGDTGEPGTGPTFLLRGSARREGDRLRIVAELLDPGSGRVLWAERFDGDVGQAFDFQDRISESVAAVLEPQIERAALSQSRLKAPCCFTAHDLYLRALPQIHAETEAGNRAAAGLLAEALKLDPDHAIYLAHAAWTLEHRISAAWPPLGPDDAARCLEYARRAEAAAEGDAAVLAHCAMAELHVGRDYARALDLARAALAANPNSIRSLVVASVAELHAGDPAMALPWLGRAIALAPADPLIHIAHGCRANVRMILGDAEGAERDAARALAVNPAFDAAHWIRIAALAHRGRMPEAAAALDRLRRLTPGVSIARIRAAQPDRFPARLELLLDGLRQAGLHED